VPGAFGDMIMSNNSEVASPHAMTADELKLIRAKYGLTKTRAAELAMVSLRRLQQWESGKYPMPAYRAKLLRSAVRRMQPIDAD